MKQRRIEIVLSIISWIVLCLAIFSYYQQRAIHPAMYDSDTLVYSSLFEDVIRDGNSWTSWYLPVAPNYFPDMLLFFFINFLGVNFAVSVLIQTIINQFLTIAGMHLIAVSISRKNFWITSMFLVSAGTIVILIASLFGNRASFFEPYLVRLQGHSGSFIVSLFCLGILLQNLNSERLRNYAFIFFLSFFTVLSDGIFVVNFVLPAMGAMTFAYIVAAVSTRTFIRTNIVLVMSVVLGFGTHKIITFNSIARQYIQPSGERISKAFGAFLTDVSSLFARNDIFLWATMLWFAIAVVLILAFISTAARNVRFAGYLDCHGISSRNLQFFVVTSILMIGSCIVAPIASGTYVNISCLRYLFSGAAISVFGGMMAVGIIGGTLFPRVGRALAFGILVFNLVGTTKVAARTKGGQPPWTYVPPVVQCVDRYADDYDLGSGISHYWNGKLATLYSKEGVRILQVDRNLNPFLTNNSTEWYLATTRGELPVPGYNFVVTGEKWGFRIDGQVVVKKYGDPLFRLRCGRNEVYVYGEDFDLKIRKGFHDFLESRQ